jgi:hypothetical protein
MPRFPGDTPVIVLRDFRAAPVSAVTISSPAQRRLPFRPNFPAALSLVPISAL